MTVRCSGNSRGGEGRAECYGVESHRDDKDRARLVEYLACTRLSSETTERGVERGCTVFIRECSVSSCLVVENSECVRAVIPLRNRYAQSVRNEGIAGRREQH